MPTLEQAWNEYSIEAPIAFMIARPGLQKAVQVHDSVRKARERTLKMEMKAKAGEGEEKPDVKMEDGDTTMAEEGHVNGLAKPSIWHPSLEEAILVAAQRLSPTVQQYYTAGFYVTFWQLSLYDIFVPSKRYMAEVDRLKGLTREIDQSLKTSSLPSHPGQVVDKNADAEKKRAKERCAAVADALLNDMKAHADAFEHTKKRLQAEKGHWFSEISPL